MADRPQERNVDVTAPLLVENHVGHRGGAWPDARAGSTAVDRRVVTGR